MYEKHGHQLLPWPAFVRRAIRHVLIAMAALGLAVGLGTIGYHLLGRLEWIDAFLNASMILSGMGPVDRMVSSGAKLFSALYALFSGLVFIGISGLVLAPWIHRLFHWAHLPDR
ncbi:MAG TPA: hypothetical protein VJP86_11345 [Vicinamibacterales bacterium]|jgi:hypothetical protein|nr:hypothetical protein [Vicinamibacterales bacterium]